MLGAGEDRTAQELSETGRDLRRAVAPRDGAERRRTRHQEHQSARAQDGGLVAADNAFVDDVRHQPRQQQEPDRLRERERKHNGDEAPVRPEQPKQFQHGGYRNLTEDGERRQSRQRRRTFGTMYPGADVDPLAARPPPFYSVPVRVRVAAGSPSARLICPSRSSYISISFGSSCVMSP